MYLLVDLIQKKKKGEGVAGLTICRHSISNSKRLYYELAFAESRLQILEWLPMRYPRTRCNLQRTSVEDYSEIQQGPTGADDSPIGQNLRVPTFSPWGRDIPELGDRSTLSVDENDRQGEQDELTDHEEIE